MIVKNETGTLSRLFTDELSSLVDGWLIVDTGSTDGTQSIIEEFWSRYPQKRGQLVQSTWTDFATARNEYLHHSFVKDFDYLLVLDADHDLHVQGDLRLELFEKRADTGLVQVMEMPSRTTHWLQYVMSSRVPMTYECVTHEILTIHQPEVTTVKITSLRITHRTTNVEEKSRRDVALIHQALKSSPPPPPRRFLLFRYYEYLAQSYANLRNFEAAAQAMDQCMRFLPSDLDVEARWWCYYKRARVLMMKTDDDWIEAMWEAYYVHQARAEPLIVLLCYYNHIGERDDARLVGELAMKIPKPTDAVLPLSDFEWDVILPAEYAKCRAAL